MTTAVDRSADGRFEIRVVQEDLFDGRGYHMGWELVETATRRTLEEFSGLTRRREDGPGAAPERTGVESVTFSTDGREVIVRSHDAPERRIDLLALTDPSRTGRALGERGAS